MTAPFSMRVAAPRDEPAVHAVLRASYPALMRPAYGESFSSVADSITRPNPALLASGTYYVAQGGPGATIGVGGWTRERPEGGAAEPSIAHLRHFATHPHWCRRGVARAIYALCELRAREAGVERLECYSSLNAEPFYDAMGFESIARIEVPMGEGRSLPGILMRRWIGAAAGASR